MPKIKEGDKILFYVFKTLEEGIVTKINDDGTYTIRLNGINYPFVQTFKNNLLR